MVTSWSPAAHKQLRKAFEYIRKDSLQNAEKVKNEIIELSEKLVDHPERFSLDKYRKQNDGTFRAFEIHSYRISYRVMQNYILIVRMRHTSRSPIVY
jgi:addiction module RelE/StbE family toxin